MKNLMSKTVKQDAPYMTFTAGDWEWRVLKAYQAREAEGKNQYARWSLAVKSPYTHGSFDQGDGYVASVLGQAVACTSMSQAAKDAGYMSTLDHLMIAYKEG